MAESTSVTGQQVADQQGVSYQELPKYNASQVSQDITSTAGITPGLNYVDKDKSTVQGQLSSLLSKDSPYLKQAALMGSKEAARRGLDVSSIGVGAATNAAIQAGLPIAQQDATTYATAQGRQQAANYDIAAQKASGVVQGALTGMQQQFQGNQTALQRQQELELQQRGFTQESGQSALARQHELAIQKNNLNQQYTLSQQDIASREKLAGQQITSTEKIADLNRQFETQQQNLNRQQQITMENLGYQHQTALTNLQNQSQKMITEMQLDAQQASEITQSSTQIMSNYQESVLKLLTNPTFLELSGADMQKTIENMRKMASNQISFLGSMTQTSLTPYLTAAFPTYTY